MDLYFRDRDRIHILLTLPRDIGFELNCLKLYIKVMNFVLSDILESKTTLEEDFEIIRKYRN
jgi:hypothetical protein